MHEGSTTIDWFCIVFCLSYHIAAAIVLTFAMPSKHIYQYDQTMHYAVQDKHVWQAILLSMTLRISSSSRIAAGTDMHAISKFFLQTSTYLAVGVTGC